MFGVQGQACYVTDFSDSGGVAVTSGVGIQSLTVAAGSQFQVTNARDIGELAGPFESVGGTVGPLSGDVFGGYSCGREIVGGEIGLGAGVPSIEGHYYGTTTMTSHDSDFSWEHLLLRV